MLSLIRAAFDRSRTVLLLFLFLWIAGILAYITIPKEMEPDVPIPIIYVSMSHDGISPDDAERLLARPMEKELQGISGVKNMTSTSTEGHASVLLEFDAGFDGDVALADVRAKVDAAKSQLPGETDEPSVNEVNVSLFPVLSVSLSGELPERTLLGIARELQDKIEALPGVLEANIAGERDEVLEILVDPLVLETYQIDFGTLFSLVRNNNLLVAAGAIDTGAGRLVLKVPGVIENINDVLNMPVKVTDNTVITFGDVATIRRTFKDPTSFARLNGQPTLVLEISKRLGANIIATLDEVRAVIESQRAMLPPSLNIGFHQDKSEQTRSMLTDLQNNILTGVILVMLVIMLALGVRSSILVGLAIPGSFLAGITIINAMGFTMNVVVLFSLILVVGMLVDGAIIVTELADRNIDDGMDREAAFAHASQRMAWPIIASTATTLAVFFPLTFWPGVIGQFMRYLPITVITCLIASLAMALIFLPVLGKYFGRTRPQRRDHNRVHEATPLERLFQNPDGSDMVAQIDSVEMLEKTQGIKQRYLKVLYPLLKRPSWALGGVLAFTVAVYLLYGAFGRGFEFFPSIEPESMLVNVHARGDLSIHEQNDIMRRIEVGLIDRDGFESVYTRVGQSGGAGNSSPDLIGTITIDLTEWNTRDKADQIIEQLREQYADMPGVQLEFMKNEGGPGGAEKTVNLEISALSETKREAAVQHVLALMKDIGGFTDISDDRPLPGIEWRIEVNREEAARYGADVNSIGNAIQLITNGIRIAGYRPDDSNDELDIRVRYPVDVRTLDQITQLRINTSYGLVALSNFVHVEPAPKTGQINRVNTRRVVTVASNISEGYVADTQLKELQKRLLESTVDPEVNISFKGEAEEQQEAGIFLITAFVSAIFLMAIFLVTQFNSLYQAFLVLTAIVFSTAGVLMGLMIAGQTFGVVMVGIGIIALAGIVVNNNIVLIDTYNRFVSQGAKPFDAAMLTGAVRVRPVLLTAVTTVLGLMPMVLGLNVDIVGRNLEFGAPSTQWWTQMASAIAGGLSFTTILTLFLTPCLLVLGANMSGRWRALRASGRQRKLQAKSSPAPTGAS